MKPSLFTPINVSGLSLPNRIVMAPLTRSRAGQGNVPTQLTVDYYRQRASAGLIITEATQISPQGQGYAWTPGIHDDNQIAGWLRVADAVHENGGRIFMQLWHVGRVSHPSFQPEGGLPVAPTAMPVPGKTFIVDETGNGIWADVPIPQELTIAGIRAIVADYAKAARNAIAAGMDGIEVHAADGYLIDQFINTNSNRRLDCYGGSIENRVRILTEVVDAISTEIGSERIGVRLTPMGRFMGMGDDTPEETFGYIASQMNERSLAYLHVVEPSTMGTESDTAEDPRWDAIVHLMRRRYEGVLMLAGGYDQAKAERALGEGRGDMVAFGKLFLANPDLPERFAKGFLLNEADRKTFFGGDARGYTDYPTLSPGSKDEPI